MDGFGTTDNLLINFMCISKDRMDEVREAFMAENDGQELSQWIDGDCGNKDYKDLLMRLANRDVYKYAGSNVMVQVPPPPSKDHALFQFAKTFNRLCRKKKADPGTDLVISEDDMQEMANIFMFFGQSSSCCPNLDMQCVYDLLMASKFVPDDWPPPEDNPDMVATFNEWDYSGSGEICWNDYAKEMTTRCNDPTHYEAEPLPENEP